jgi:hypothetical protein
MISERELRLRFNHSPNGNKRVRITPSPSQETLEILKKQELEKISRWRELHKM